MTQRILAIFLIVIVLLNGGYYAYQRLVPPPAKATQGPVYATQPVKRGDISVGVDASGPLNPSRGGGIQVPFPGGGPGPRLVGPGSYIVEEVLIQIGQEVETLKDKPDQLVANIGQAAVSKPIDPLTGQLVCTGRGQIQTPDDVQQGGLARTGRPHDRDEPALLHGQVDPPQGVNAHLTVPVLACHTG